MQLSKLHSQIYESLLRDVLRLYRVVPKYFQLRFWRIFSLQLILAILETSTILVISFFAMSLSSPEQVLNNIIVKTILAHSQTLTNLLVGPRSLISFASLLTAFFIFIKNIFSFIALSQTIKLAEDISLYICTESLNRYLHKSYFWHISPESSEVIHRMSQRSQLTSLLISMLTLYSNVICCLFLFSSLFLAEPFLTMIVMSIFAGVSLATYIGVRRRIDRAGQIVAQASFQEQKAMHGIINNVREVILYHQEASFLKNIYEGLKKGAPGRIFLGISGMLPSWLLEVAGFSTICGVTIWMSWQGRSMPEIIQAASMLMLTSWRVLPAVVRVSSLFVSIRGIRPQALPCLALLETFTDDALTQTPDPDPNFNFKQTLTLKNVFFRYPLSQNDSLLDISLTVKKGEKIGLVGLSGAGKSTLALLFSGLLSPHQGDFKVDNRQLTPPEHVAYLKKIGFVPQAPMLMGGTIADNVAFSRWGQDYSREEVTEACRMAAMDFVLKDPKGIDRVLAEGGSGLSGGQAQRVAIARALFIKPDIIIFDEATSALDSASENIIASTIKHFPGETTVIIIAHRLTTVEKCDRIIWLNNGRIQQEGSPKEILPLYESAMEKLSE